MGIELRMSGGQRLSPDDPAFANMINEERSIMQNQKQIFNSGDLRLLKERNGKFPVSKRGKSPFYLPGRFYKFEVTNYFFNEHKKFCNDEMNFCGN